MSQGETVSIFIASSSRGLKHATALRDHINNEFKARGVTVDCRVWKDSSLFRLSKATLTNLQNIASTLKEKSNGYAVILFTPDDKVFINGRMKNVNPDVIPRDNVIFELGFFMGQLGDSRTICVNPANQKIKILSDWNGITNAQYDHKWATLSKIYEQMKMPAKDIVNHICTDDSTPKGRMVQKKLSGYSVEPYFVEKK